MPDKRLDEVKLVVGDQDGKPNERSLRELLRDEENNMAIVYWFFDKISSYAIDWLPDTNLSESNVSKMLDMLDTYKIDYRDSL